MRGSRKRALLDVSRVEKLSRSVKSHTKKKKRGRERGQHLRLWLDAFIDRVAGKS